MKSIPPTLPKFLWHFAKRYKLGLAGLILVAIFWALNISLSPYAMKLIIDRATEFSGNTPGELFEALKYPAIFFVSISFIIGIVFTFYDWIMIKTFPKMKSEIIQEMFDYVEGHSYNYFQQNFAGSLSNKIMDMAKSGTTVIINLFDDFIARGLSLVVGGITMYLVNPVFSLALLIWGILFSISAFYLSKKSQVYSEVFSHARSSVVGKVVDSISNILNVMLFARQKYESRYLHNGLDDVVHKDEKMQWYLLKVKTFYSLSITILVGVMTWLLIDARAHNLVTIGDFALILTLTMWLVDEFYLIANELVNFSEEVGICQQALSVISTKHDLVDSPSAVPLRITHGEIEFDQVHFRYKKGQSIFKDKSITIYPGEKVGLVGYSGSGKSTFVNLILRFFEVDSGRILIDGQDISQVTQESLRDQIAVIPQDPVLFHRSLMENIRYGRLDATDSEVIQCSKNAHCYEFIEKMKDGFDVLVGERGVKLSGGQRQRIAIARAMLKNAKILILDEATSSLDSITESYIQESLAYAMEGRTTLVIAHRLSTLYHMDRILVFSDGKIIEDGTHAELLELEGHYANLWSMQAGGFLSDTEYSDEEDEDADEENELKIEQS